jgi:hypothetical protein
MSAGLPEAMAVLSRKVELLQARASAVCEALHADITADKQRRAAKRREALEEALIEQRLAAQEEKREQEKRRMEARYAIADAKEAERERNALAKKPRLSPKQMQELAWDRADAKEIAQLAKKRAAIGH